MNVHNKTIVNEPEGSRRQRIQLWKPHFFYLFNFVRLASAIKLATIKLPRCSVDIIKFGMFILIINIERKRSSFGANRFQTTVL